MLELITIVVEDYDPAISFFVEVLDFELVEDTPSLTNDGRAKRWVVVRPRAAQTGILLARADGDAQRAIVGNQLAGRVGFFLRVHDFEAAYSRMRAAGVAFVSAPRTEPYGRVVVFLDIAGNRWDQLLAWTSSASSAPGICGGQPCFRGTRTPVGRHPRHERSNRALSHWNRRRPHIAR